MKFGLFGGARLGPNNPLGDSYNYKDFVTYVKDAEELGLREHLPGRAPFHGRRPALGFAQPALLSRGLHHADPAGHRRGGAAVAQPGPARRADSDGRRALRRARRPGRGPRLSQDRVRAVLHSDGGGPGALRRVPGAHAEGMDHARAASRTMASAGASRTSWSSRRRASSRIHRSGWRGARRAASPTSPSQNYGLLLDQLATLDQVEERVRLYLEGLAAKGFPRDASRVGVTRALSLVTTEEERKKAQEARRETFKRIGDIARRTQGDGPVSYDEMIAADDAGLIGTPDEIVEKLRDLARARGRGRAAHERRGEPEDARDLHEGNRAARRARARSRGAGQDCRSAVS